jgi:hypothetical protein
MVLPNSAFTLTGVIVSRSVPGEYGLPLTHIRPLVRVSVPVRTGAVAVPNDDVLL